MSIFTTPLIILFLFFILISTIFIVRQQSAAIVERFGKFQSVRKPGIQVKIPLVDRIAGRLSLKVLQLDVVVETKTSDDVFVKLKVSVQYRVVESKVFDALSSLSFINFLVIKIFFIKIFLDYQLRSNILPGFIILFGSNVLLIDFITGILSGCCSNKYSFL